MRLGFHPLYRGTWFPTGFVYALFNGGCLVSIRYIAVLGFQPPILPRGLRLNTSFPSAISRYLVSNDYTGKEVMASSLLFPSAISRYLVSNTTTTLPPGTVTQAFPSAISRYLVSNLQVDGWAKPLNKGFPSAISRYLVSNRWPVVQCAGLRPGFPSAISRYLVSNPTSKTPPLTSGGGNGLHTPRRIDHIPTFASLNHDKNTRSTHYTPNAGIELSETTPPPLRVNPVQK